MGPWLGPWLGLWLGLAGAPWARAPQTRRRQVGAVLLIAATPVGRSLHWQRQMRRRSTHRNKPCLACFAPTVRTVEPVCIWCDRSSRHLTRVVVVLNRSRPEAEDQQPRSADSLTAPVFQVNAREILITVRELPDRCPATPGVTAVLTAPPPFPSRLLFRASGSGALTLKSGGLSCALSSYCDHYAHFEGFRAGPHRAALLTQPCGRRRCS